jgi:hypothetical protein
MNVLGVKIRARQIQDSDVPAVVNLLASGFTERPQSFWSDVLGRLGERAVPGGLPRYGYLLENHGTAVGAILLIFASIRSGGRTFTRCNLSSWYVQPAFRGYASLLVSRALGHKDATYLNITPASHTLPILLAQGYENYSKGIVVALPALAPRAASTAQVTLAFADRVPSAPFEPLEHELLLEHARYGCISLWCETADGAYPFVFRPRLLKRMLPCAQLIYCREIDDVVRLAKPIGRFLATRGRPLLVIDANGPIPGLAGRYFDARQPKYFKGLHQPRVGDLLYTEAALFGI